MAEQLALLDAPAQSPRLEIKGEASLSDDGLYRWWLSRYWRAGPYVLWCMLNPSTADATQDDPTLKRIIGFTQRWGYAGLVVVNLYPFRSSKPAECRKWAQTEAAIDATKRNWAVVEQKAEGAGLFMAAWGAGADGWDGQQQVDCVQMLTSHRLFCLGTTASGAPTHPLARGKHRVPDDQQPIRWTA